MVSSSLLRTVVCLAVLALLAGCVSDANYKILNFFFDGVPKPGQDVETKRGVTARLGQSVSEVLHGPYAARLCSGCHEPSSNRLVLPVEKLCLKCHRFNLDKKYIHGPLASGGCIVCHDPHRSKFRFLLKSDSRDFCLRCHNINDILKNEVHTGTNAQCTDCHDAHMSDVKYMLK